jgi:ATP-dependent DNA ligase
MKALLVEDLPSGQEWIQELKFDRVRALAIKDWNSVTLLSRAEKNLAGSPHFLDCGKIRSRGRWCGNIPVRQRNL